MINLIRQKQKAVDEVCRKFGVGSLEVFGSAAREDFDPQSSDLDFIATFLPPLHPGISDRFFGLSEALENIFARPVDLLTDSMLQNPVLLEEVNRDRVSIYDYRGQKAAA